MPDVLAPREVALREQAAERPSDTVVVDGQVLSAREAEIRGQHGTLGDVETAAETTAAIQNDLREAEFGGTLGALEAAAQGGARALTFGASDLALEALGQEEILQGLREVNPAASIAGEVGGAVLSLFAGGAGAAKAAGQAPTTAARIAALTPRGALAARGMRWASGATTAATRAGRRVAVEAIEGGADLASAQLVRQLLADQEIDGSEIGAAALKGVLLGGAAGVAGETLGGGLGLLQGALGRAGARKAPSAYDSALARASDDLTPAEPKLADLLGPNANRKSLDAHYRLESDIRTAARRGATAEADEVLKTPALRAAVGDDAMEQLGASLAKRARAVDEAGALAETWRRRYARALGQPASPADYARRAASIDPALTRDGSKILARLDDARDEFAAAVDVIRRSDAEAATLAAPAGASPLSAVALPAPGAPANALQALRDRVTAITQAPSIARLTQAGSTLAAGAEVANAAGVDVPSVSSLLGGGAMGKAAGLFLSARALGGRSLGDSIGALVPGMKRVVDVAAVATKHRTAVRAAAVRGLEIARGVAPKVLTKAIKAGAKAPDPREMQAVRAAVEEATRDVPALGLPALAQIDRAERYLQTTAPKPPNPGSPWAADWQPDPISQRAYDRRAAAVADPTYAVETAFSNTGADLEIEALREVHPVAFAAVRDQLSALDLDGMASIPYGLRHSLSRGFGVPLLPQYLPGYGIAPTAPPAPQPQFARPSTASASPLVTGEVVRGPKRNV